MNRRWARLPACTAMMTLLALIAGCAQQASTTGSTAAQTHGATAATTATPQQPAPACASRMLTVTIADNNKSMCVTTGTVILVNLRGTLSDKWGGIHSSSAVLAPKADPRLLLQVGFTGAGLEAIHPGVATISSVRNPCLLRAPTAKPSPAMRCTSTSDFRLTLTVKSG